MIASDEAGVNRSFNFPHVRFTCGGGVKIFSEPGDYKLSYFRGRTEADGWHRSDWDRREVIHAGSNKVHFDTQFLRYRAYGSIIGSYTSIYITTLVDSKWVIQARSCYALYILSSLGTSLELHPSWPHRGRWKRWYHRHAVPEPWLIFWMCVSWRRQVSWSSRLISP